MSALDEQFHKLWGQAKEQCYDKPAWIEMQRLMGEWTEAPKWFAEKLLKLWPLLRAETQAEILTKLQEKEPKVYEIVAERLLWQPFTEDFDYEKKFYDVQLPDGTVIEQCYPNSGVLNAINGSPGKAVYTHKDNIKVRLSLRHPMDD